MWSNYQIELLTLTIFLLAMLQNWCLNVLIKKSMCFVIKNLRLQKIDRVLEFNHSQWLKPYFEYNTQNTR